MRAWDESLDFRELAKGDAEIAGRVDLADVFDDDAFTRNAEVVFARLQSLVTDREEVNA
jgi:hypothetical protein